MTNDNARLALLSLLPAIETLARKAGALLLEYYHQSAPLKAEEKADLSPVTEADRAADVLIRAGLAALPCSILPASIPIVTEESFDGFASPPPAPEEPFWLVDPLDGTKEFLCHRDEFTVNIALIIQRRPVLGVVYVPARGELYSGAGLGTACLVREDGTRQPIAVVPPDLDGLRVVSSLSHGNPEALACFLAGRPVKANIQRGSSLKFCSVARGEADLYPRLGPTCEWDTAAGHAVLEAAGGTVLQLDQTPLLYGKFEAKLRNPHFIAVGG